MTQLALNLRLRDSSSFDNFYPASNREALARLRDLVANEKPAAPPTLFLWGDPGSGRSHLLQAACRAVQAKSRLAVYVPCGDVDIDPRVLESTDDAYLICLDDVNRIAGNRAWESALFALYELMRSRDARLVAAASAPPRHLGLVMPELATRFGWGAVYQLHAMSDDDKLEAIVLRARNRGLEIAPDVARYILRRYPRDLESLFALLDRIDVASLQSQRRITIPFLRELESFGAK